VLVFVPQPNLWQGRSRLLNIYGSDSFFVLEAWDLYERNDGKTVTIQAVAFTALNKARLVTSVIF
jgi:hypothetical protein